MTVVRYSPERSAAHTTSKKRMSFSMKIARWSPGRSPRSRSSRAIWLERSSSSRKLTVAPVCESIAAGLSGQSSAHLPGYICVPPWSRRFGNRWRRAGFLPESGARGCGARPRHCTVRRAVCWRDAAHCTPGTPATRQRPQTAYSLGVEPAGYPVVLEMFNDRLAAFGCQRSTDVTG